MALNRYAYRTTGLAIKAVANLSRARIKLSGTENIPEGSIIFVINHFTRVETFLMPYQIFKLTQVPVWSLASYELFKGPLGAYLDKVGAVSTKSPDRDRLIVKSLLTGEAHWIIFPEGRMVKNKKIVEKGRFMISYAGGKHPPHTGAATLALRTEFYRQRLKKLLVENPDEANYLLEKFEIDNTDSLFDRTTYIVPVNLTYYPIRARENILSNMASSMVDGLPDRIVEEIMTEGTMLLTGVDLDIRFGRPIPIGESLECGIIHQDMCSPRRISFDEKIPSRRQMRKEALLLMQEYMTSIYGLTTVNHDHLFASMLRAMPWENIDPKDLCRRVFLVAEALKQEQGVHLHRALQDDQTHLLTDDRYQRYQNFVSVALEKGILKEVDQGYIKDRSKFSTALELHRARIDNPIEVMANAVEPLKNLQKLVRQVAWLPKFIVKRRVVSLLLRQGLAAFDNDYRAFYIPEESKPRSVGRPYLIRGRFRRMGVVLIHGYMAAPLEVKELARFLGRHGIWVYAPRVKGHGTAPEDLAIRTHEEWIESVEKGYAIIRNLCKRVVVGGFSNGAGLALDLAARIGPVDGVFAVCPPLQLQDISSRLVPAVAVWNRLMKRVHLNDALKDFVENSPENPDINYVRNPISGVRELERLMAMVAPRLANIESPALIVQAQGDPVVNPKGSKRVFDRLGTTNKTYVLVNFDRHGILRGEGSHRVHQTILNFIQDL